MIRRTLLVIAFLSTPMMAQAHDWYAINDAEHCESLSDGKLNVFPGTTVGNAINPEQIEEALNSYGFSPTVQKISGPTDNEYSIEISADINGTTATYDYYPSIDSCQYWLNVEKQDGTIVNPSDLN